MTMLAQLERRAEEINHLPFRSKDGPEESLSALNADDVGMVSEEEVEDEEDVYARDSQRCKERTGTGIPRLNFATLSQNSNGSKSQGKSQQTEIGKSGGKDPAAKIPEKKPSQEPEQVWFTSAPSPTAAEDTTDQPQPPPDVAPSAPADDAASQQASDGSAAVSVSSRVTVPRLASATAS